MKNLEHLVVVLVRLFGAYSIISAVLSLVVGLIFSRQLMFGVFATNVVIGIVCWLLAKSVAAVVTGGIEDE